MTRVYTCISVGVSVEKSVRAGEERSGFARVCMLCVCTRVLLLEGWGWGGDHNEYQVVGVNEYEVQDEVRCMCMDVLNER